VLRSQDRPGLEQEIWALLTLYQLLRMAMVSAVESRPDTNPDRASFTTALQAARDQVVAADGILPADQPDLLGVIGRAVLNTLLPARRPRWSTRRVKNATSRYLNRDDRRPHLPTTITSVDVTVHTPNVDQGWRRRPADGANGATRTRALFPRPDATSSPPSWKTTLTAHGQAANSPTSSASNPATCSPNSPNGLGSASSPAPTPAPTHSRHAATRAVLDRRLTRQTSRHCSAMPAAPLTLPLHSDDRQLRGSGLENGL